MRDERRGTRPFVRATLALLFLLVAQVVVGGATVASAQVAGTDSAAARQPHTRHPEAVKAIDQLKSPYCKGFMLEVCSSAQGAALRDSIDALAYQGWAADSIVNWVLANHGQEYLALPRREGKALVAWIVPPVAVGLGFALVIFALRQMAKGRAAPPAPRDLTGADEDKLKDALRDLEAEEDVPFI